MIESEFIIDIILICCNFCDMFSFQLFQIFDTLYQSWSHMFLWPISRQISISILLEKSENLLFSKNIRGYRNWTLLWMGSSHPVFLGLKTVYTDISYLFVGHDSDMFCPAFKLIKCIKFWVAFNYSLWYSTRSLPSHVKCHIFHTVSLSWPNQKKLFWPSLSKQ